MYATIQDFLADWKAESASTGKVFAALTNKSLNQTVTPGGRTLGSLVWHVAATIPEMMSHAGLQIAALPKSPPQEAARIAALYRRAADELAAQVSSQWSDADLKIEDDMYGLKWTRGLTLQVLVRHQIHHRAQATVLMRQAGLVVPGVYGPAKEEWAKMGMKDPETE